jgi:hypothetical protein
VLDAHHWNFSNTGSSFRGDAPVSQLPQGCAARENRGGCISPKSAESPRTDRARYHDPVPEISRFFGIVIRMFVEPGAPHHRPHFHAYYQSASAVYAIDSIECIGGDLPERKADSLKRGPSFTVRNC